MKKLGLLVDSSCALSKEQANKLGLYFAPIIVDFNNKEYEAGIDIDTNFLNENMDKNSKVKTAAVRPSDLEKLMKKASKECEEVLVITLSKHLSSVNDLALTTAKKFKNVIVYDSNLISVWFYLIIEKISKLAEKGKKEAILEILDSQNQNQYALLLPKNLDSLYSGGRITKTQYLIGSLIKVNPIIPVVDGTINSEGVIKGKGVKNAIDKSLKHLLKKKKEFENQGLTVGVFLIDTINTDSLQIMKDNLVSKGITEFEMTHLSPEILAHVGPGAIGAGLIIR